MKKWKSLMSAALTVCMVLTVPMNTLAALSDYDEETAARLQDNKLEFDELQNLAREYNPDINSLRLQLEDTRNDQEIVNWGFDSQKEDLNEILADLKDQKKELIRTAKENHMENSPAYQAALAAIEGAIDSTEAGRKSLSSGRKGYNKPVNKGLDKLEKGLDTAARTMTGGLQTLMINYDNIVFTLEGLQKVKELQEKALEAAKLQQQLGMTVDTSVISSQAEIYGLEANINSLTKTAGTLRVNLLLLTGWSADSNPEIGHVPDADVTKIASMNLEADTLKAIGNNQTLIQERHTSSKKSTAAINNRLMNLDESEQKLQIEMERLYKDVQAKKISYDAAMVSYEKARLAKEAADRQYQLKMISELQYLGAEVQFANAEIARKSADTALLQSMLNYDWAVQGFVKIPD